MARTSGGMPPGTQLRLTHLEDRALPATAVNATLTAGILRLTDWKAGDAVTVHQTAAGVTVDAAGTQQVFVGVGRVWVDVQSDARVTNDTAGLGTVAARPVQVARRDSTGRQFDSTVTVGPGVTVTAIPDYPADWFDTALSDPGLRTQARSLTADHTLDRLDMLKLFAQAATDGTVSAAELHDLTALDGAGGPYTMPDSVRELTAKVVGHDAANATYQGAPLGDLAAGGSDRLTKLVNKWFLGLDRPKASSDAAYRPVSGPLFRDGPAFTDVAQGRVDDCYFLAALAAVAKFNPQAIQNMIADNGDGTFTVRFFHDGVADYVTVDRSLPTDAAGNRVYASFGGRADGSLNELWVALVEKAYAQANASGWLGQDGTNTYAGIAEGYGDLALQQITGQAAGYTRIVASSESQLAAELAAGHAAVLNSRPAPAAGIVAMHAYAVVGYDATAKTFTLYNPQGRTLQLTWDQIVTSFAGYWRQSA